jgi:hypothetical protein
LPVLGDDGEGRRSPTDPPPMPDPAEEHLEGVTGPGGIGASSSESGEAASSGDGEARPVSFLSSSDAAGEGLEGGFEGGLGCGGGLSLGLGLDAHGRFHL